MDKIEEYDLDIHQVMMVHLKSMFWRIQPQN